MILMKAEVEALKVQLAAETAARALAQEDAASLRSKVAALEENEAKSAQVIQSLKTTVETLNSQKADMEQQIATRTAELAAQLKTSQAESEETEKAFNALHERYEQLKKIHAVAAKVSIEPEGRRFLADERIGLTTC
jgi:hypothetical protein